MNFMNDTKLFSRQTSIGSAHSEHRLRQEDSDIYSFESVETNKSNWQAYKAMLYVRFITKFREPAVILWFLVIPVAFCAVGIYLSGLGTKSDPMDKELQISPSIYTPHPYGFQNYTQSSLNIVPGIKNYLESPLESLDHQPFSSLVKSDHVGVFKFTSQTPKLQMHAWYNDSTVHSIPVLINTISNAFAFQYSLGEHF